MSMDEGNMVVITDFDDISQDACGIISSFLSPFFLDFQSLLGLSLYNLVLREILRPFLIFYSMKPLRHLWSDDADKKARAVDILNTTHVQKIRDIQTVESLENFKRFAPAFFGRLRSVEFNLDSGSLLKANMLPESVTHLAFGAKFNQPIKADMFPGGLTHLALGEKFNETIDIDALPQTLRHVIFGAKFNKPIKAGMLSDGLTHLTLGEAFNETIDIDALPQTLRYLVFGTKFNRPTKAGIFQEGLTYLAFGYDFNQPILAGVLPSSVIHLIFGRCFNQPIVKDALPNGVTHLVFGRYHTGFSQRLKVGMLPDSLVSLRFGALFDQFLDEDVLPNGLKRLVFKEAYDLEKLRLPSSLSYLEVRRKVLSLRIITKYQSVLNAVKRTIDAIDLSVSKLAKRFGDLQQQCGASASDQGQEIVENPDALREQFCRRLVEEKKPLCELRQQLQRQTDRESSWKMLARFLTQHPKPKFEGDGFLSLRELYTQAYGQPAPVTKTKIRRHGKKPRFVASVMRMFRLHKTASGDNRRVLKYLAR